MVRRLWARILSVRSETGASCASVRNRIARIQAELSGSSIDSRVQRNAPKLGPSAGFRCNGAAQESNLPSDGLRRLTGFEDRLGHRARAAPRLA
jgi:hypothetical protein